MTSIETRLAAGGTLFAGALLLLLPSCGGGLSDEDKQVLSGLKTEILQNRTDLQALQTALGPKVEAAGGLGAEMKANHDRLISALGGFSQGFYDRLEAAQSKIDSLKGDGKSEAAIGALQKDLSGLGEKFAALETAIAAHVQATAEKLEAHGAMGQAVQAKLDELAKAHGTLETSLQTGFGESKSSFQNEAKRFEGALQELGKRLDSLAAAHGAIQKDVAAQQKALQDAIQAAQAASTRAVQEAQKAAQEKIDALDAKVMGKLGEIEQAVKAGEGEMLTRLDTRAREIGKSTEGIPGMFAKVEQVFDERFQTLRQEVDAVARGSRDVSTVVGEAISPVRDTLEGLAARAAELEGRTQSIGEGIGRLDEQAKAGTESVRGEVKTVQQNVERRLAQLEQKLDQLGQVAAEQRSLRTSLVSLTSQVGELKSLETNGSKVREQTLSQAKDERAAITKELTAIREFLKLHAATPTTTETEATPAEASTPGSEEKAGAKDAGTERH